MAKTQIIRPGQIDQLYRCCDGGYSTTKKGCDTYGGLNPRQKSLFPTSGSSAKIAPPPTKKASSAAPSLPILPKNEPTSVVRWVSLNDISTNTDLFQEREKAFAQQTVDLIISRVANGTFRWDSFVPIQLWYNSADDKLYILSGHSRTEAFRQLMLDGAIYDDKTFDKIPATIIVDATLEEAQQIALTSNLSTTPKDTEKARLYRRMLTSGKIYKEVAQLAKEQEGSNANLIMALAYLNPEGMTLYAYKNTEEANDRTASNSVKTVAQWIGTARQRYPQLSNFHEDELFKWLNGGAYSTTKVPGKITNMPEFLQRIQAAVDRLTTFGEFDDSASLNLERNTSKSPAELEYERMYSEAIKRVKDAEKNLLQATKDYIARGADEETMSRLLIPFRGEVAAAQRQLKEVVQQRDTVREGTKNQSILFGIKYKNYVH